MSEWRLGTIELHDGELVFYPDPTCPCGRDHSYLDSDDACSAAERRRALVLAHAIDTSRAVSERRARIEYARRIVALGSPACRTQRKRATSRRRARH